MRRLVVWRGLDTWRAEVATLDLSGDSVTATGTQLGIEPVPYRLDYELRTGPEFVTETLGVETLGVEAAGGTWARQLRLVRRPDGSWECDVNEQGDAPLPPPGGDVGAVDGALDCDLARSPLTNLMPVRRHRLHERPGEADFLMAWVSVPDLGVHASPQRYEHVRRDADESVVRYVGRDPDFVGDIVLDRDGIVERYPDLAQRVHAESRLSGRSCPP